MMQQLLLSNPNEIQMFRNLQNKPEIKFEYKPEYKNRK
jgi:hypothetical protein